MHVLIYYACDDCDYIDSISGYTAGRNREKQKRDLFMHEVHGVLYLYICKTVARVEGALINFFDTLSLYYFTAYIACSVCAKFKLIAVIIKFCCIEAN